MRAILSTVLVLAAALPCVGHAQGLCLKPFATARPSVAQLARFYPNRAVRDRVDGLVQLSCDQTAYGRLLRCVVVAETPPGYGFGQAALKLAKGFMGGGCADKPDHVVRRHVIQTFPFRLES